MEEEEKDGAFSSVDTPPDIGYLGNKFGNWVGWLVECREKKKKCFSLPDETATPVLNACPLGPVMALRKALPPTRPPLPCPCLGARVARM